MLTMTRIRPGARRGQQPVPAPQGRALLRGGVSVLAAAVILAVLVLPANVQDFTALALLRIPIEAVGLVAVLALVPRRIRRPVAVTAGLVLGLVAVVKIADLGFSSFLYRPFDLVADWVLVDDGLFLLLDTLGVAAGWAAAVGLLVLVLAVPAVCIAATLRLAELAGRKPLVTGRTVLAAGACWSVLALLGVQVVPGRPVAAADAVTDAAGRVTDVRRGLADQRAFLASIPVDRFAEVPAGDLLTGLSDKDVLFVFVESYGRSALEDPVQSALVGPALADSTATLRRSGFEARSGFLTSSTIGGYSWLAHATFHSGLWIDNQRKYRSLVSSGRLTLPSAFHHAGWHTVAVEPGNTYAWPEGAFYRYDRVWDSRTMGYRGPSSGVATMPDQYTMAHFQREVYGTPHPPTMAEITLVSSHGPWSSVLPEMVGWDEIGDGSIFHTRTSPSPGGGRDGTTAIRSNYASSIAYSVSTAMSWVARYGRDDLVVVMVGDHAANPLVSGEKPSFDVPVTIVAKDDVVLGKAEAAWGWQSGLHPSPQAPVRRMDTFRNDFLKLYS